MDLQEQQPVEDIATPVNTDDGAEDAAYEKIWDDLHSASDDTDSVSADAQEQSDKTDDKPADEQVETKDDERPRDEKGKFKAKEPKEGEENSEVEAKADDAEEDDVDKTEVKDEPESSAIVAPVSLSAEMKEKWGDLSPEWQQTLATREQESAQAISRMGNELHSTKPMSAVAEQFQVQLEQMGVQPHEAFANLMANNQALVQDPQTGILNLAQSLGVDLVDLALSDAEVPQHDPQIAALSQQVQQLQGMVQQGQSGQPTQQADIEQRSAAAIDQFASDKPDFEQLGPMIQAMIPTIQAESPLASQEAVLAEAYKRAQWANPTTRQTLQQAAQATQQQQASKRAEQAKRASAINVTSAVKPTGDSFKTEDEAMEAIYDSMANGA